jgi:hypothetical protein
VRLSIGPWRRKAKNHDDSDEVGSPVGSPVLLSAAGVPLRIIVAKGSPSFSRIDNVSMDLEFLEITRRIDVLARKSG